MTDAELLKIMARLEVLEYAVERLSVAHNGALLSDIPRYMCRPDLAEILKRKGDDPLHQP